MQEEHSSISEVKIPADDLKIGMYVSRLDKDWTESSFLFQGFKVKTAQRLRQLQKECLFVFIDVTKGEKSDKPALEPESHQVKRPKKSTFKFTDLFLKKDKFGRKHTHELKDIIKRKVDIHTIVPPKKSKTFDQEIDSATSSHKKARRLIRDFMRNVQEGGTIDMILAKESIDDCIDSILRSPDAMLLLMRLKNRNYSVWQHSMNVSVLAINLGRFLNLSNDELTLLGLAGMFHDIGKLQISKRDLLNAVDKRKMIESHTTLGREVLLNTMGQLAETAADVAYSHHERLDGLGYPEGLRDAHISAYTRMIAILNHYDNLISDKGGQKAFTHYEAMSDLLEKSGTYFDADLVNSFNCCIGTYPVGSVVEMSSGEIAMVVEENENQKLRPKIMLLTNADKEKCMAKLVNLATVKFDEESEEKQYSIRGIVRAETYGLKL